MGSIPEFVTRQLPSSVTGTLGIDTSGVRLGESIAEAGGKIANLGFRELAKRKETLNITEAEAKQRSFDVDLTNEIQIIQENFKDNPDEALAEIGRKSNEMKSEFLAEIKSDRVKQLTAVRIEQNISQKTRNLQQWGFNQEVINFGKNLETSVDTLGEILSNTTDETVFTQVMEDAETLFESSRSGLSSENAAKFENGTKQFLAEQFINNLLEKDPIKARGLLAADEFTDLLPPAKKEFLEARAAENAFMVEADGDMELATKNINENTQLTPLEKVNATNKWFNKKAAWDTEMAKIVKENQKRATTKIYNDIQEGVINDISVLRELSKGFELPYNVQKSLEQDFENKISGKTVDNTIAFNFYFDELLDGVDYGEDVYRGLNNVSPEDRLRLLDIRAKLTKDPIFRSEIYIESKKLIDELYKVNLFNKIDPNFQDKKITSKWNFIQAIISRRDAEGQNPENINQIVSEEFLKIKQQFNENRGVGITTRSSSQEVRSRKQELLQKVIKQSASEEEKEELRKLNEGR